MNYEVIGTGRTTQSRLSASEKRNLLITNIDVLNQQFALIQIIEAIIGVLSEKLYETNSMRRALGDEPCDSQVV